MRVARNYLLAGMAGVYLWSAASIPMRREALATESFSPTLYAEKDPSPGVRQLLSQFCMSAGSLSTRQPWYARLEPTIGMGGLLLKPTQGSLLRDRSIKTVGSVSGFRGGIDWGAPPI